jgi:hypothetical protein
MGNVISSHYYSLPPDRSAFRCMCTFSGYNSTIHIHQTSTAGRVCSSAKLELMNATRVMAGGLRQICRTAHINKKRFFYL